jgi:hypothetical protein
MAGWDTSQFPTPLPTLHKVGHDEHYAIHTRHCATYSHHYSYGRDKKGRLDVNLNSYGHGSSRVQGMVRGRGSLGSPFQTMNRGRHGHYRYGRP